jgi:hypothetical protein
MVYSYRRCTFLDYKFFFVLLKEPVFITGPLEENFPPQFPPEDEAVRIFRYAVA